MIEETVQTPINQFTHYVGVTFDHSKRSYYFGSANLELKEGDRVVVETARGLEVGTISYEPISIEKYKSALELKPVVRKATDVDLRLHEINAKDAQFALEICKTEVNNLHLDMRLISAEYTLDKSKIIFTYVAEERVDFRELLKVLASRLHTRIELRQIGSRDKAKLVGGIGMCGLPLCCSTFLNEFDGISISRAKNQMLAINIPKLSGHCGKLLCCLKFEDDAYTDLKAFFPEPGHRVFIDKVEYVVNSINVISRTVRVDSQDDIKILSLDEFKRQTGWKRPKPKNEAN